MTVAALNTSSGPFTANGATTVFPFTFSASSASEVQVLVDGAVVTVGFTITLSANQSTTPGGSVTFTSAPANGAVILITSNPSFQQLISFKDSGPFLQSTLDLALDRIDRLFLYLRGLLSRAILVPVGETIGVLPSVAERANRFLYFDSSGQLAVSNSSGAISAYLADGAYGDITVSAGGTALSIGSGKVSLANMANLAATSLLGNNTGSPATPLALTGAQVTAMLPSLVGDTGAGGTKGVVPAPAAGDAAAGRFLKADGTWAAPPGSGAGTTTNALTLSSAGDGDVATSTFNGSLARKISYNSIGAAPLASPALTGTPTAPTAAGGTNTTQLATTAFVATGFAPLASPTFTGAPAAPTATAGTSTTQLATTAFVQAITRPSFPGNVSASFSATDADNNTHKVASGAAQTLTLGTLTAGTAFTIRFTTVWSLACAGGLSKNGVAPGAVTTGSVAANSLITFFTEGGGVWLASGQGLS